MHAMRRVPLYCTVLTSALPHGLPACSWWYRSRSHAAELTAGYYNTATHDGYAPILELCARFGVGLTLTCVEMCDGQHPVGAQCSPEGLLKQVRGQGAQGMFCCAAVAGAQWRHG